jgi:hypothetical protein
MRRIAPALLCVLAACEIQPPPPRRNEPPPAPAPTPAPVPAPQPAGSGSAALTFGARPPDAGSGAGSGSAAKPAIEVTAKCLEVGVHVADVLIKTADSAQRAVFESERERIVRATGEACTTQAWSEAASACYLATTTQTQVKDCETKFTPTPRTKTPPRPVPEVQTAPSADGKVPEPIRKK